MVAFTNALPQEMLPQRFSFSLALLVLRSEYVAKSAKKILLVEDNDEIRELLALFMKHLGYKVFAAARGLEAIDRASVVHPDLILMDIRMPGMHGDDATARLKANPSTRDIPVLVVTAYGVDHAKRVYGQDFRGAGDVSEATESHAAMSIERCAPTRFW